MTPGGPPVSDLRTEVLRFPTPEQQADGTLSWDATVAVVVTVAAGGQQGLGWTYSDRAAESIVLGKLGAVVRGHDAFDVPGLWEAMVRACRNLGRPGIVSQAIAAVDIALWDLKAKLLDVPLTDLFGRARAAVPVYGSGGFTSLTDEQLSAQVEHWLARGVAAVKIKIGESWGTETDRDLQRVRLVRSLVPDDVAVMVDANGGYTPGQARRMGAALDDLGVVWFEEPVSSDDLDALSRLRGSLRCDIAAGEYADSTQYTRRMCDAGAVDCMQLDVTRCAGYTEWLRCAAVAASYGLPVSGHCAPALHAPVAAAVPHLRHVEWFIDHERLEPMLVDGVPEVVDGAIRPSDRPGHGMQLRPGRERFAV
jgi:L-alanine-DL-glutamate epimerase-like enolase superfamily enzyme